MEERRLNKPQQYGQQQKKEQNQIINNFLIFEKDIYKYIIKN